MEDNCTMRPCATDFSIAAIMSRHGRARARARDCDTPDSASPMDKFLDASSTSVPSPPELGSCTSIATDAESGRDSPVDVSSTSESSTPSQSHGETRLSSKNPLLQERWTSEDLRNVTCHLETKDLWDKFNELGTEMIITKTGSELRLMMPSDVATFLRLPNPEQYTLHCYRRSSATTLADAGVDITNLICHGGWLSTKVAEWFVKESIENKKDIDRKDLKSSNGTVMNVTTFPQPVPIEEMGMDSCGSAFSMSGTGKVMPQEIQSMPSGNQNVLSISVQILVILLLAIVIRLKLGIQL